MRPFVRVPLRTGLRLAFSRSLNIDSQEESERIIEKEGENVEREQGREKSKGATQCLGIHRYLYRYSARSIVKDHRV